MYSLFGSNYFRRIGFNLIELISCNRSASVYKMPKKNAKTKINNSSEENKLVNMCYMNGFFVAFIICDLVVLFKDGFNSLLVGLN